MDLQNHIVEDVVAEKITEHDGGGLNTLEVRGLLREFPSTEMAFIFPASVVVPNSTFHVRTNSSREELDRAPRTVFYIELSKVLMVPSSTKLAIVLSYSAGPTGTRPKGTVWAWASGGDVAFSDAMTEAGAHSPSVPSSSVRWVERRTRVPSRRPTSRRGDWRRRRRDTGVTSTYPSCGARAAERVRPAWTSSWG